MNRFALGAVAGTTSLLVAVPLLAQFAGAASTGMTGKDVLKDRPIPTQACVQALADQEAFMLGLIDTTTAAHKSVMQAHHTALVAAAAIADDTARAEALKKAHEEMRTAMKTAMEANKPDTAQMEKLKTACGDSFHGGFGGPMMKFEMGLGHKGMKGMKGGPDMLATKLGMTADELKTALSSGKTIEQIATEKGITLPAKKEGMMMRFEKHFSDDMEIPALAQ